MTMRTRDLKGRAGVEARTIAMKHTSRPLRVKSGMKAGGIVKAGIIIGNHNVRVLRVASGLKAGRISINHSHRLR